MRTHEISVLSTGLNFRGTLELSDEAHIYAKVDGEIHGQPNSKIIIRDQATIKGVIHGDRITIEGFVEGKIIGESHVHVTSTGRVFGEIRAQTFSMDLGGTHQGPLHVGA